MKRAVIVSAVRTAIGKHIGQWTTLPSENLAAAAINGAIKRANVDPVEVEDIIMGNIYGPHGNHARISSMVAGLPLETGAVTIDRQCGSGTQAIVYAALNIAAGYGDVFVACGVEHMTTTPYQMEKIPGYQWQAPRFLPNRLSIDAIGNPPMYVTADTLAARYGVTREECDQWALISHQRAAKAREEGTFKSQIIPIDIKLKNGIKTVDTDECIRPDTSMEKLAALRPLSEGGITTAGNACPRSDGAGAVIVMSEERAKALGIQPIAAIKSFATVGLDPNIMGYGPVPASRKALKRAGLIAKDIEVVELNEAFAGQVIPCMRDLELDPERVNPNGGAIAMGHPLGGTGAVLTTKLLDEMVKKDYQLGMVTMCIGGGQGMCTIFERV